jgi:multiple antibiotic resistance protein
VDLHLQAVATMLSLMNPVVCAVIFERLEAERSAAQKVQDATRAAVAVMVILWLAALFGARALSVFGVSLDVFSVAGGGVLVWMGSSMLRGAAAATPPPATPRPPAGGSSLTPLILFAASPGTITGVITLAVSHSRSGIPVTALVAVGVGGLVTWAVMLLVSRGGSGAGGGGFVRSTVQSLMGLIVIAMGVQFGLTGLRAFMQGPG